MSGEAALRQAVEPTDKMASAVAAFYLEDGPFAGHTFLGLSPNPPNEIGVADLLAVTLMDEHYRPDAIRDLLEGDAGTRATELLRAIPQDVPLWKVKDLEGAPDDLWWLLCELREVGPTRASKLMARKRPHLIPVYDSIVGEVVAPTSTYWEVFRSFLASEENRAAVDQLRPPGVDENRVPTLRLLDTAIWLRHSRSTSAQQARQAVGLG
jgi:hypothetical protein